MKYSDLLKENKAAEEEMKQKLMDYRKHIQDVGSRIPLDKEDESAPEPKKGLWNALAKSGK